MFGLIRRPASTRRSKSRDRRAFFEPLEMRNLLATIVWDGGGSDANWTTAENWSTDVAPTPGDNLVFPVTAIQRANTNDFAPETSFGSVLLSGNNYHLSGNAILLGGNVISQASGNTLSLGLKLAADATISAASNWSFDVDGRIDLNGHNLNASSTATLTLAGAISGEGNLLTAGNGVTILEGDSSYTGTTTASEGTLLVRHAHALGAGTNTPGDGTVVMNAANLQLRDDITIASEQLSSPPGNNLNLRSLGDNAWQGDIASGSYAFISSLTGTFDVSGDVSVGFILYANNSGGGTVVFDGDITSADWFVAYAGTVVVNGVVSAVNRPEVRGTLLGSGDLTWTNSNVAPVNGTINPGGSNSPGVLTIREAAFNSGSKLSVQLNGTVAGSGYDQLVTTHGVSLGGNLEVALGFVPAIGDTFTLLDNTSVNSISGTFNGLAEGSLLAVGSTVLQISYMAGPDSNDVTLTVVAAGIWDGGGSDNRWSTGANWVGDVTPGAGARLIFPAGAAQPASVNDFAAGTALGGILISGGNYHLSGAPVTLSGSVVSQGSGNELEIDLVLGSDVGMVASGAAFTVGGDIDLNGSALSTSSASTLTLGGVISGAGDLLTGGNGWTRLLGNNSYGGVTTINSGTLSLGHDNALGTGSNAAADGTVLTTNGLLLLEGIDVASERLSSEPGQRLRLDGYDGSTWGGDIAAGGQLELNAESGTALVVNGAVSGHASYWSYINSSTGAGLVALYDGLSNVNGMSLYGTLLANSSVATANRISVYGTLAGMGPITSTTSNPSVIYGALSPGDEGWPGILTIEDVEFQTNSTLSVQLNGTAPFSTDYDIVDVTGSVKLAGELAVTLGFVPQVGDVFTILNNDGADAISGTFDGLVEGSLLAIDGVALQISYAGGSDSNDVTLTAVAAGIWDGGGSDNRWSTAANWAGDVTPGAGANLIFPAGAAQPTSVNDFAAGTALGGILISGDNYSLSGAPVALSGSIAAQGVNNAFNIDTVLASDVGMASSDGSFVVGGDIDLNGNALSTSSASTLTLGGVISGAGDLLTGGTGTTRLEGDNSYSGVTTINSGSLVLRHANALGAGSNSTADGTVLETLGLLRLEDGINVAAELLSSAAGQRLRLEGYDNSAWGGDILAGGQLEFYAEHGTTFQLNGEVIGASGYWSYISNGGGGAVAVNGGLSNVYGMQLYGTLLANSSVAMVNRVDVYGTLAGAGPITSTSSSVNFINNTLNPGPIDGPGVLTIEDVRFQSSSTLAVQLDGTAVGTGYDQLVVAGSVTLAGELDVTLDFVPSVGDVFTILSNDGADAIEGTFNGLPEGSVVDLGGNVFEVSYVGGSDNNDIVLTTLTTNHPPDAEDVTINVIEDVGTFTITLPATDADGHSMTFSIETPPEHGVLGGSGADITYTPDANYTGTDSFVFKVTDSLNGVGTATVTINLASVNDRPAGTDATVTTLEDAAYVFAASDFGFMDPSDALDPNAFAAVKITTLPGSGRLMLDDATVDANDFISAADLAAGKLLFTPSAGASGDGYASFTFQVMDDGPTNDGSQNLDASPNTITVDVTPVNDAPASADAAISTSEDIAYVFRVADFGFSDPSDAPADAFQAVVVTTLPTAGTLTNDGVAVAAGATVSASDIAAGKLAFHPQPNAHGAGYASFAFQVQDDGGDANGGADLDLSANTISIDVTAVNDAPVASDNSASMAAGAALTVDVVANDNDADAGDSLSIQSLGTISATLDADNSPIAVSAGWFNFGGATITFTPGGAFDFLAAGETATVTVEYVVADNGSPVLTDTGRLAIQITGANEAPVLDLNGPDGAGIGYSASFVEGGGVVVVVDGDLTLTDAEGPIESATVTIANLLDGADEMLAVDTTGASIVASYDANTGVLSLSGAAAAADYQAVLRTVTYNNTSTDPNATPRAIEFAVSDGVDVSATATATVEVTPMSEVSLAVSPAAADEDTGALTFTFTRTAPFAGPLTVSFDVGGSALFGVAGADYTATGADAFSATSGSVTFAAGEATAIVSIAPAIDSVVELDETVTLTLAADSNYNVATAADVTVTIANDDSATVTVLNVTNPEALGGLTFSVLLSAPVDVALGFDYATQDGTAQAGLDYTAQSGSEQIDANELFVEIFVPVADENLVELHETFNLLVSNLQASGRGVTLADGTGLANIVNDDSATLSIIDVGAGESLEGLEFAVSLSNPVDTAVGFDYATQDGTAVAGLDYTAADSSLSFNSGETLIGLLVTVTNENVVELHESLQVLLSNLQAGGRSVTFADDLGEALILNDDSATVSIGDVSAMEGSGLLTFTVTLDAPVDAAVTVDYETADGSAVAPGDYASANDAVTLHPAAGAQTQAVEITVAADSVVELNETLQVLLSNLQAGGRNVSIADGSGVGTIQNDDSATVSIDSVSGVENGGPLTFTVTLSGAVDVPVGFDFATQVAGGMLPAGVNAARAADFSLVAATPASFATASGSQTLTFEVPIVDENLVELDELFEAVVSNLDADGRAVTLGTPVGTGTIENDDSATLSISSQSAGEGADVPLEGNGQAFTVTLSAPVDTTISFGVDSQQVAGGAVEGVDYAEVAFTGTIAPEDGVSQTYFISISDDATVELDEVFELLLSNLNADGRPVTLGAPLGATTIENDDQATLAIAAAAANEDTGELTFSVTLSHAVDVPVDVDVSTLDVALEALAGSDYVASAATLSFAGNAGETQQFTVTLNLDNVYEDDEDFQAQLGAVDAQGRDVVAATTPALGTILNDDALPSVTISASPTVISEAAGVSTVTVELSNPSENPVVVNLALSGSATVGLDYGISATSITLDPLAVSGAVTLTATLDALSDDAETAVVAIDSVTGGSEDGEQAAPVLILEGYDFGDAPASYGTLNAASPHHLRSTIGVRLGTLIDFDPNGQPGASATGDDTLGWDDEDGVTLPSQLVARVGANFVVNASEAGRLDAWIDFNRNGVFDASERIANSLPVAAGNNNLYVDVPSSAVAGLSYARFRISSVGGLGPIGFAPNGEVEDYAIQIVRPAAGGITLTDDPLNPGRTMLVAQGTSLSDTVVVQPIYYLPGWVLVSYSGQIPVPVAPGSISRLVIFGEGSSDAIAIDAAVTIPAYVYGDEGNDSIVGGGGDDYLYGGAGYDSLSGAGGIDVVLGEQDVDMLYGGLGHDVLIGGAAQDWLYGQDGDDLLIGSNGPTSYPALAAIQSAWSSPQSFNQRVAALSSSLNAATVTDDAMMDFIYGNGGSDWQLDFQNRDFFLDYFFLQDRKN